MPNDIIYIYTQSCIQLYSQDYPMKSPYFQHPGPSVIALEVAAALHPRPASADGVRGEEWGSQAIAALRREADVVALDHWISWDLYNIYNHQI